MRIRLKWMHQDTDRHGNVRTYFWRRGANGGPKVRIHEAIGSDDFFERYRELVLRSERGYIEPERPRAPHAPEPNTLGWLVERYKRECQQFLDLESRGQQTRAGVLEHILNEPIKPGSMETFRSHPLHRLKTKSIRVLRDRKANAGLPGAADNRVRALRGLFSWASSDEDDDAIMDFNPAAKVAYVSEASDGWHTWTEAEVQQFEARHPRGTKARLALALLMYTGVRRSDVVGLGKQHETAMPDETGRPEPWIRKRQVKGRRKRVTMIEIPLLPILAEEIAAGPSGHLAYLVTEYGQPFTANGFGGWFRERCDEAELYHCSAHGLRKAGAARAAEKGATSLQLMAIFNWRNLKEAEHYTKAAERKKMARAAMGLLARDVPTESVPTEPVGTIAPENTEESKAADADWCLRRDSNPHTLADNRF